MDFTAIFIGLGIIILLFIVGEIFAILLLVAAVAVGIFFWNNNKTEQPQNAYSIEYKASLV